MTSGNQCNQRVVQNVQMPNNYLADFAPQSLKIAAKRVQLSAHIICRRLIAHESVPLNVACLLSQATTLKPLSAAHTITGAESIATISSGFQTVSLYLGWNRTHALSRSSTD